MQILFLGNKNRGVVCLDALLDRGDSIVGVVAPPESSVESWYPSLADHASERNIPVHRPADINDPAVVESLAALEPELIVMAGYSQILHEPVLEIPDLAVVNLHGGKLPEYRGASTLNWMIIEGERKGGIAVLFADEGIDTGEILVQKQFPIETDDTIVDVIEKTDELFPGMLVDAVERIESGDPDTTPQSRTEGAYYHSRRPRDGEIRWRHQSAEKIYNLVRALDGPYPSAFTTYDGGKLLVEEASLLEETIRGIPGRIARRKTDGVVVVAADRGVLVEAVRRPEEGAIEANEFFETVGVDLGG